MKDKKTRNDRHIQIFDTTLRDGQQCPGAGMSFQHNLEYARLATELGIDILEAGFPAASKLDFEIVNTIATEISPLPNAPVIACLCQLREEQVDVSIESLMPAVKYGKARLHTYVPVDPELMKASLGGRASDKEQIVKNVHDFVKKAASSGMEVEFSPEGYSRMGNNFDFVADLIRAAVEGGALVINCPDSIGGACELQGNEYFVAKMNQHAEIIRKEFPNRHVIWSTHCHNDFGLAVINSVNAVFNGPARQIEGCINGIGERAGNTCIEQCIMVIKHFAKYQDPENPFHTTIRTEKIQKISDFVAKNMLKRQPHWPITGDNAAKHSSGSHTNAILKNPLVYQPFDPAETGKEITFVFGPLSGGNHAKAIVEKQGYRFDDAEKPAIAQFVKDFFRERRKGITDEELMQGYFEYRKPIKIEEFDYSRSANKSEIFLKGQFFSRSGEIREAHQGRDSALAALKNAIDHHLPGIEIVHHKSASEGEGIHAVSVSTILLKAKDGATYEGVGRDQDIEISAMKALIDAANHCYIDTNFAEHGME